MRIHRQCWKTPGVSALTGPDCRLDKFERAAATAGIVATAPVWGPWMLLGFGGLLVEKWLGRDGCR